MERPFDLPDFENPPLSEVALGVQFVPPEKYSQIYAKDVWDLYRREYPILNQVEPIPPTFETFGSRSMAERDISLQGDVTHDRYWFISEDSKDLIQFQSDRLLHNWRKVPSKEGRYPRFESIIEKYERELRLLEDLYCSSFGEGSLHLTQCEATYINLIPLGRNAPELPEEWIKLISLNGADFENFSFSSARVIRREDGAPSGRCIVECRNVISPSDSQTSIELKITVRGAPETEKMESAIWFLYNARNEIVRTFASVTTEVAHKRWERK
ncbi:TIGR04255 family protein [Teredinibacter sp. KSP-S5-2]|uniref:TIGR04255 family protein n=1 Tax=Teredinibacter sp. KSP-S5-2 TaxID=3034506 RepID=UPI002934E45E|nr:TIGR04255 family protein [Teredinibacter sp. KSP-S5-2]WNO08901.1 TIGR04255 family protein [Teredinibacter sp. KSP-S5-2]